LNTMKKCNWLERKTGRKGSPFDTCQFWIRFKGNWRKWFAFWKTSWTKNLYMTRNYNWFESNTRYKYLWSDAYPFWIRFKWNQCELEYEKHDEERTWTWRGIAIVDLLLKYRINGVFDEFNMESDSTAKRKLSDAIEIDIRSKKGLEPPG
jgi:hypothetical protein